MEGTKCRSTEVVKSLDKLVTSVMSTHSDESTASRRGRCTEKRDESKEVPPSEV